MTATFSNNEPGELRIENWLSNVLEEYEIEEKCIQEQMKHNILVDFLEFIKI